MGDKQETFEALKNGRNMADKASMSHRCWNCGQRLEKVDVLHSGVMTAPRVYFHRVGQRRQHGYGLWVPSSARPPFFGSWRPLPS